jgi:N-acetylneuraminate synthase
MTQPTCIIAEAGVNHNGSLQTAKQLVDVAAEAGADVVKFQSFRADRLATQDAPKADYQRDTTDAAESQIDMLRRLELSEAHHFELIEHCRSRGLEFLSTPFDLESARLLVGPLNVQRVKIASGELTNAPLLLEIARSGKPVLLSTGMATLGDIEQALGVLAFGYTMLTEPASTETFMRAYGSEEGQRALQQNVVILHCTTEYPTPFDEVNLRAMDTLAAAFGLPVGLSDHTLGIAVAVAAVARGATVIEKHFTLDRNMPGPDHKASVEPEELRQLVQAVRQVEAALGSPHKSPTPSERRNMHVARKSLVAACDVKAGEKFTPQNVAVKRPGTGVSPMRYFQYLGTTAEREYRAEELLS